MILARLGRDQRGVAAVEMSLVTGIFAVAMMNAVELGRYAYVLMEAGQATQAGAEAAYVTCDAAHVPATENCPNLADAVTTAIHSTSLGSAVSLHGDIGEGYYCLDSSDALVFAGDVSSKPADCSAYGQPSLGPALYLQVSTTYAYAPMLGAVTLAQAFPATINKTSWMRML
ncbi:MAG TPA: TadE/TadG family type IV pilus assembly protein [Phenylobacterium sp.]|jgi:hypothetical protein|nr:TadE/TadG family type IV pilus assembly protein [Phenylobacterium sp.]